MKPDYTNTSSEQSNMAGEPAVAYAPQRHAAKGRRPQNRVYIEDGEVKMNLQSDTMTIEEAKELTLKMVDLEYSLP